MYLTLQSLADVTYTLQILSGTIFITESIGVQRMVSIECQELAIDPAEEISLTLDVACASMNDKEPSKVDFFTALPAGFDDSRPNDFLLAHLVSSAEFQREKNFRIKQFAVWIVTDDPARGDFVRLGGLGTGSGPTKDEISKIQQLIVDLEIKLEYFKALK